MAEVLRVNEILGHLELKDSMVAAEFGCGAADFALALAKKLTTGKVYALDIQEEKLSALKGKAAVQGVSNISTVHCDLEAPRGSGLQDSTLDLVLIPNVLFQAENKYAMIEEGKRILKPGGSLLIIDWLEKGLFGPREGMVTPDELKKIAELLGLSLQKEFAAGDYHFALVFTK